ncbi:MAG: Uncharacterized protein FD161_1172 [Limisphaerales bacterium]|nr:MAG: Uncharacterized protein FD161_1172 [Limisphaerales bacterium]KAG0509731.1 MAG: Uncharacterized protein E1N63_1172 [Limisphaerales bacterium]TXT47585.1 MAG: Uncharacterized protein FD140_4172 [Limisphaerales bacterium]
MANPLPSPAAAPPVQNGRAAFLALLAALTGILAFLFAKSFLPEYIVFANDGPLGLTSAAASRMPDAMFGLWADLNWVGNEGVAPAPSLSNLLAIVLSPVAMAKVIVPLSLLLLGCAAWVFFRQCGFAPWVCTVGGLAAGLNGDRFSVAAWGLSMWVMAMAAVFLALAAVLAATRRRGLVFTALAGFATGLGVMEGFDTGALFSLVVAAFAVFLTWTVSQAAPALRLAQGVGRIALVATCAAFIATYTLGTLISTQVKGVADMGQDKESRDRRYEGATIWSLPKIEALRVLIPGLFGYRMAAQDGSVYWGTVGQNPGYEQIKQAAERGDPQMKAALANPGLHRHSGSGEYGGVLVVLLAAWAIAQASRKQGAFTDTERKLVWFWAGIALVSLLFAFGKYAPFYKLFYSLPYASTIRNPVKFMHPFHLALLALFGYGLHALARQFVKPTAPATSPLAEQVKGWWDTVRGFERSWTIGTGLLVAASLAGLLLYSSARKELEKHLVSVAFSEDTAKSIASHSIGEVGVFVLFLALSAGAVVVALSGYWSGARARWAGVTLGLLLALDLARANAPWIVYWNYPEKYASNPIIELLKRSPHEGRVQALPFQLGQQFGIFQQLYGAEWTQHLFLYNNIQTLDITQEPRPTAENQAYRNTLSGRTQTLARLWELTNTRYLFGLNQPNVLNELSHNLDADRQRFRIHTAFDLAPKPGVTNPTTLDQVTVVTNGPGQLALIEFTGALPRAKLFTHWLATTNDAEVLSLLTNATFNPHQSVIVSAQLPAPTNAAATNAGDVKFLSYAPKLVRLEANAAAPSILLLNDKYAPNWKVAVDGQPATLLRCNYLMRGVQVPPGKHEIVFRYEPPITGLYVTTAAGVIAFLLLGLVLFTRHADGAPPVAKPAAPPPAK